MDLLMVLLSRCCCYWLIAFILSGWFGIQGILIKRHEVANENIELKEKSKKEWSCWERVLVHYTEYFIFNFVCGLAGFAALYVDAKIVKVLYDNHSLHNISSGTAALLIFLTLIGIIGAAGKLSFVVYHGKIFGSKA